MLVITFFFFAKPQTSYELKETPFVCCYRAEVANFFSTSSLGDLLLQKITYAACVERRALHWGDNAGPDALPSPNPRKCPAATHCLVYLAVG